MARPSFKLGYRASVGPHRRAENPSTCGFAGDIAPLRGHAFWCGHGKSEALFGVCRPGPFTIPIPPRRQPALWLSPNSVHPNELPAIQIQPLPVVSERFPRARGLIHCQSFVPVLVDLSCTPQCPAVSLSTRAASVAASGLRK